MIDRPVTLPDPFWGPMPAEDKTEVGKLESGGLLLLPTGSRWICPEHHGEDSDFDLYGPADPKFAFELLSNGWESPDYPGATPEDAAGQSSKAEGSISLYRGRVNLILFYSVDQLARFKEATDICRSICVTKREDRVRIFRAVCREN